MNQDHCDPKKKKLPLARAAPPPTKKKIKVLISYSSDPKK